MNYLATIARSIEAKIGSDVDGDSEGLYLIYAILARITGVNTTAENVHDAWNAWMLMKGESHESMVPFAELPSDIQAEDQPFVRAIREVAEDLLREGET